MVLGWPSALDEGRELGLGLGRLRSQLELSEAESRRVLVKNPMLLGQSYEAQLLPMCEATQARTVHAVCMPCACRVHAVCMACAWRVHGVCMALHGVAWRCMPCATHLSVANLKSDEGVSIPMRTTAVTMPA